MKDQAERQRGFDGNLGVLQLPSARADAHGLPRGDRFRRQPQGDVASLDQCSVVRRPVSDAVFRFVPGMHSRLHVEIMPLRPSRWPGPRRTLVTAHQRLDQQLDEGQPTRGRRFNTSGGTDLCETSSWRLLCCEACRLGLPTTRVSRAVRSRRVNFQQSVGHPRTVQKLDRGVDGRSCITLLTDSSSATSHRAAGGTGRDHGVAVPSTAAGSGDCRAPGDSVRGGSARRHGRGPRSWRDHRT